MAGCMQRLARLLCTDASTSSAAEVYDVAIVGGGMVGAALACKLSTSCHLSGISWSYVSRHMQRCPYLRCTGSHPMTSDLRVVVLDRGAPPDISAPLPAVPELRVSTITPASIQLFRDVGAWEDIEPRSAPFAHMQVTRLPDLHADLP